MVHHRKHNFTRRQRVGDGMEVRIYDGCGDGFGVKVWAWLTWAGKTTYLGDRFDSNGPDGPPVIWDPFRAMGNVKALDDIGLKICLVDSNDDPSPKYCFSRTVQSLDG